MKIIDYLKNNKIKTLAVGIFLLLGLYYFWLFFLSGDFFTTHSENQFNRKTLLEIRGKLQVGDNYEKVLRNYWAEEIKSSGLKMSVYSSQKWLISMPSEFWSTDWRMHIKFEDGKVVSYKVRTSDGQKTKDMPEDTGKVDE